MDVNDDDEVGIEAETETTTHKDGSKTDTIKIATPKGHAKPRISVVVGQEIVPDAVSEQVSNFVTFLREHAIVGLALGFVIGTQVQAIVKQLVTSVITPFYSLVFGGQQLDQRTVTLHFGGNSANFGWGAVVYVLVNFLFILATVYALIKIFNLDKLEKPKK